MPPDLWQLIERLGVPLAFAVVAVWALVTEKIMPGRRMAQHQQECTRQLDELRKDRDYYRRLSFDLLKHNERVASSVERAISATEERP